MTLPDGIKFNIDIARLQSLISREDHALGAAMIDDAEVQKGVSLSLSARTLAIASFEAGYAAALTNVVKILECQPSPPANPPVKEDR